MNIRKKAVSGVKWTSLATIIVAIVALLKISILARFLDVSDFGLMALVSFVLGFMDLFMDMGLTSAILHKQNIKKEEYTSLYWLNVCFSLFLFLVIVILSPFIADFYNEEELNKLIPLAGLAIPFSAIGRQHKTILQKNLNFKTIALIDISVVVLGLTIAIILAIENFGVYSLVYSALIQFAIGNIVYFAVGNKSNPLFFHFNFKEAKPFLKIGIYQVGGQIVNYFNRDIDVLIIGKFFGSELLGGYSLAKQLVRRPISIIDTVINKVAISILPRYQSDNKSLLGYFIKLITGLSFINAFVYGAIAITAPLVIIILYGEDYIGIVNFVRLYTFVVYFRSISGLVGILSITKGRTDIEFYWNILVMMLFPVAILIGANISIMGAILSIAAVQIVLIIPSWYMFYRKLLSMPFNIYVLKVFFPFAISIMVFLLYFLYNKTSFFSQVFWSILLFFSLFVSAYFTENKLKDLVINYKHRYVKFFSRNK